MRWRGESVCIVASGPSLTECDVAYARRKCDRVMTINESWRMCLDADVCYGADSAWWVNRGPSAEQFRGERWTQDAQWRVAKPDGLKTFKSRPGITIAPRGSDFVYTGHNSSFQALGMAVAWGAEYIVFLGLDLSIAPSGANHWHGDHLEPLVNTRSSYPTFRNAFDKAAPVLKDMGVTVVNASRRTELTAFSCRTIREACEHL